MNNEMYEIIKNKKGFIAALTKVVVVVAKH